MNDFSTRLYSFPNSRLMSCAFINSLIAGRCKNGHYGRVKKLLQVAFELIFSPLRCALICPFRNISKIHFRLVSLNCNNTRQGLLRCYVFTPKYVVQVAFCWLCSSLGLLQATGRFGYKRKVYFTSIVFVTRIIVKGLGLQEGFTLSLPWIKPAVPNVTFLVIDMVLAYSYSDSTGPLLSSISD